MIREAKIILPLNDNNGESLHDIHASLQDRLMQAFGGYTGVSSFGGWLDPKTGELYRDKSITYTVAAENSLANREILRDIAGIICNQAGQECIYICDFYGNVDFIFKKEVP